MITLETALEKNYVNKKQTIMNDNYYHRRGITVKACKRLCKQLGLNPCQWSHLSTAFEILKTKYALR